MKIYTKTGDRGTTALIGGKRVSKHHIRIEAYGTVDELNSNLGMLGALISDERSKKQIERIQNNCFVLGAILAEDNGGSKMQLPELSDEDVVEMENWIDEMEKELEPLQNFVLPGGSIINAQAHICRCICRRAERIITGLNESEPISAWVLPYVNRLSDFCFTMARYQSKLYQVAEIPWIFRK